MEDAELLVHLCRCIDALFQRTHVKALLEQCDYALVPVQNLLPKIMLPHFCDFSGLFCRGFLASIVTSLGNQKKTSILAIQQNKKLWAIQNG